MPQHDRDAVLAQIGAQHESTLGMLREWIALPSIAAENRNYPQGPEKSEAATKKALGVEHWIGDESWHDANVRLVSQPTINIEGLVGGYTGPGGKTIRRIAPSPRSTCGSSPT